MGPDRVLSPIENPWDSFFLQKEGVTEDFMTEPASQDQPEREPF
jgi:antitoxin VapB